MVKQKINLPNKSQTNIPVNLNSKIDITLCKWFNKLIVSDLAFLFGFIILVLSISLKNKFINSDIDSGHGRFIGNIVFSLLVLFFSLLTRYFFIYIVRKKHFNLLHDQKTFLLTIFFGFIPIVGLFLSCWWKKNEKYIIFTKTNVKNKMQMPSSIIIIFWSIVIVICLIWIIYLIKGPLTYHYHNSQSVDTIGYYTIPGILDVFLNPLKGFAGYTSNIYSDGGYKPYIEGTAPLIVFLLVMGALITLVNNTKAFEAGIGSLVMKMKNKTLLLIPILILIFSIGGTTFGMSEETIPLYLIIVPAFLIAGFDVLTGVLVILLGAGLGTAGSIINPFVINISIDSINSSIGKEAVTLTDGIIWRLIMFFIVVIFTCFLVTMYAKKVKANPTKSIVYLSKEQIATKYNFDINVIAKMDSKKKATLWVFGLAFLIMIFGYISWEIIIKNFNGMTWFHDWLATYFPFITSVDALGNWGIIQGAFIFFIAAVIVGIINWKGSKNFLDEFYFGAKDFLPVAFIIAMARGLSITLTESGVNTLLVNGLSSSLTKIHSVIITFMLFVLFMALSFFIPSTSGLSTAIFPVIGPTMYHLESVSISSSITTFSWGAGIMNILSPTGMTLPALETIKMQYIDLFKGAWKIILLVVLMIISLLFIASFLPKKLNLF